MRAPFLITALLSILALVSCRDLPETHLPQDAFPPFGPEGRYALALTDSGRRKERFDAYVERHIQVTESGKYGPRAEYDFISSTYTRYDTVLANGLTAYNGWHIQVGADSRNDMPVTCYVSYDSTDAAGNMLTSLRSADSKPLNAAQNTYTLPDGRTVKSLTFTPGTGFYNVGQTTGPFLNVEKLVMVEGLGLFEMQATIYSADAVPLRRFHYLRQ